MTLQTVSEWRIDIVRKAAGVYAQLPAVAAIMLIGGLARGRGDRYSDVDLACFWLRPPLDDERRAGLNQLETALAMPTALGELSTQRAFEGDHGLLWEETAHIGVSAGTPFNRAGQHKSVSRSTSITAPSQRWNRFCRRWMVDRQDTPQLQWRQQN